LARRQIIFGVALLGAGLSAAGVVAVAQPFDHAAAQRAAPRAGTPGILEDLRPGSVVKTGARGSLSVTGSLTDEGLAEVKAMNEAAEAGPELITCDELQAEMTCEPVPDAEQEAITGGEPLYARTVRSDVSRAIGTDIPVLNFDELFCDDLDGEGAMSCSPAGIVSPSVPAGTKLLVTYKAYHATINPDGILSVHMVTPDIPLGLAP
jgi:hypothetical protein